MKISDDRLSELKELECREMEARSDFGLKNQHHTDVVLAFTELQQHRAEKHERRWRKISEEGLPDKSADGIIIQIIPRLWDGHSIDYAICFDGIWVFLDDCELQVDEDDFAHWRPQLTDLPEGE